VLHALLPFFPGVEVIPIIIGARSIAGAEYKYPADEAPILQTFIIRKEFSDSMLFHFPSKFKTAISHIPCGRSRHGPASLSGREKLIKNLADSVRFTF
jgi:hypothetical protein